MKPVVLIRTSLADEEEHEAARKHFQVYTQRTCVKDDELVIPRYAALPEYKEFEQDIRNMNGRLINDFRSHCYVADLRNWYYDLAEYTPRTWFYLDQIPTEGPFVLKGQTNSRKQHWNTHMFADNKYEAVRVHSRLIGDSYIGAQDIYVREYIPLKHLTEGFQGLPICEEYRFFVLDGQILCGAFYWAEHGEYIRDVLGIQDISANNVPRDFLDYVISIVSPKIRFFVIDVAKTENNEWIVVELNDGQQSGLSENDPDTLYGNMRKVLNMNS